MYQVNIKVEKKKKVFLVDTKQPSIVESVIANKLEDEVDITSIKEVKFTKIEDNKDKDFFYHIIEESEELKGKIIKENHLIKADNFTEALAIADRIMIIGEIIMNKKTDILDILEV